MVTCHMFMFDLGFSTSPQQLLSLKVKIGSLGLTHENIRKTHSKDKDQCIYISESSISQDTKYSSALVTM